MADLNMWAVYVLDHDEVPIAILQTLELAHLRFGHQYSIRPVRLRLLSPLHDIHAEDHDPQEGQ